MKLTTIWEEIKEYDKENDIIGSFIGGFVLFGGVLIVLTILFQTGVWGMIIATLMFMAFLWWRD